MTKSHVGMETKVCLVCGKSYDTGALLLHKRLAPVLERHVTTGWGLCPEHQKLFDEGFVAVVAADPEKSDKLPNGNIRPEGAYRTGAVAHIKRSVFSQIFNVPIADDMPAVFCDPEVIDMLQKMQPES